MHPMSDSLSYYLALVEIANVENCCWTPGRPDDDVVAVGGVDVLHVVEAVAVQYYIAFVAERKYADFVGNVDYYVQVMADR